MQNSSSGRESSISGRNSAVTGPGHERRESSTSDSRRQRSISTVSTNRTVLELRNVMEHRPSSAKEAALETFAVTAKKRICVVRKFGSHMDIHVSLLAELIKRLRAKKEVILLLKLKLDLAFRSLIFSTISVGMQTQKQLI